MKVVSDPGVLLDGVEVRGLGQPRPQIMDGGLGVGSNQELE